MIKKIGLMLVTLSVLLCSCGSLDNDSAQDYSSKAESTEEVSSDIYMIA